MKKTTSDSLKKIKIAELNQQKFLNSSSSGWISWSSNGQEDRVGIESSVIEGYLRISYIITDIFSGENKPFDYKVQLTTTPCYFGGHRYWFECPLNNKEIQCGRRVGVLYKLGDLFGCRHCYNLTYASRNISGFMKPYCTKLRHFDTVGTNEPKHRFYKGIPTKRYARYLQKQDLSYWARGDMIITMSKKIDEYKRRKCTIK